MQRCPCLNILSLPSIFVKNRFPIERVEQLRSINLFAYSVDPSNALSLLTPRKDTFGRENAYEETESSLGKFVWHSSCSAPQSTRQCQYLLFNTGMCNSAWLSLLPLQLCKRFINVMLLLVSSIRCSACALAYVYILLFNADRCIISPVCSTSIWLWYHGKNASEASARYGCTRVISILFTPLPSDRISKKVINRRLFWSFLF